MITKDKKEMRKWFNAYECHKNNYIFIYQISFIQSNNFHTTGFN